MKKGVIYAFCAYLLWGLLPIYWKLIQEVSSYEIVFHRMIWSFVFCVLLVSVKHNWQWLNKLRNPRTLVTFCVTATLIGINWLTYIWAVNSGFIVETSLGYFINPLVNVLFGVLFLKERLRIGQLTAILLAAAGVLYLTFHYGRFPWIALILALTFAIYGLLRKTAALGSLEGLAAESGIYFIPALALLIFMQVQGSGAFGHCGVIQSLLLMLTGLITALPLLLFAAGARKITMTSLGILQYIAPTLQFLIGVFIYHESFPASRFRGFLIIWIALVIYTLESLWSRRKLQVNPDL